MAAHQQLYFTSTCKPHVRRAPGRAWAHGLKCISTAPYLHVSHVSHVSHILHLTPHTSYFIPHTTQHQAQPSPAHGPRPTSHSSTNSRLTPHTSHLVTHSLFPRPSHCGLLWVLGALSWPRLDSIEVEECEGPASCLVLACPDLVLVSPQPATVCFRG